MRAFHRVAFLKYLIVQLVGGGSTRAALVCFSIVALMVRLTNFFALKYRTFAANEQESQRSV